MRITFLPGDGVGAEVTSAARHILIEMADSCGLEIESWTGDIGGEAIRKFGTPLPESTIEKCLQSDAVFLGAVGLPEFDHLPPSQRPESGLLALRRALGGFANLRPARAVESLPGASPLREEIFAGTDLLIVRELLGGLYFGEPRAYDERTGEAYNTMRYSADEVERVARIAFEAALGRKRLVTSVDKANVLETSRLWRETVSRIAKDYPAVLLEHLYVDACAMHLVTNPTRFDVILTENLFGDILSDEAAVLTGSLGMLASATIGGTVDLYEPVHGSAPDIAGKNIANPLGAISSAAMLLRYTAKQELAASTIESAIERVLADGYRTPDLVERGSLRSASSSPTIVSTGEMGSLVAQYAVENANAAHAYHAV